jgi:uncharacterized protein YndB with AHSA1/START domain
MHMRNPLILEQVFDVAIEAAWKVLTDEEKMRIWYFPQLKKFKPIVGFDFEFADDGSDFKKQWRVTQVTFKRKLAHTWNYKGYPGHSEVTFTLSPEGSKTRLRLTHTGLESFPNDPHFARRRFETGWDHLINTNLKSLLTSPA